MMIVLPCPTDNDIELGWFKAFGQLFPFIRFFLYHISKLPAVAVAVAGVVAVLAVVSQLTLSISTNDDNDEE
jgi:hypothetical protein